MLISIVKHQSYKKFLTITRRILTYTLETYVVSIAVAPLTITCL